jgi:signal transduction histidine kinase
MMKHVVVLSKRYGDLAPVPCYPMQLKQVFMNLLVNAYQAIEEAIERRGERGALGTVMLTTAPLDGGVSVEITDTGTGIAPDHLDRIFDPFFTTKKVGAGTGLGLSTSFNIVRRHGGTMRVESALGRGTTFRIELPLLSEEIGGERT